MSKWQKFQEAMDIKGGMWVTLFSAFMLISCGYSAYQTLIKKNHIEIPDSVKAVYFTVLTTFAVSKTVKSFSGQ